MTRLHLDLPERLKATAEQRAAAGRYASVDEYVASFIEADNLALISDEIEAELLKGLASGPAVDITPQFISDSKQRVRGHRGSAS